MVHLPVKVTGNVELLTSDHDNSVPLQEGLRDDCGQAAQQVAPAVNQNRLQQDKTLLQLTKHV